MEDTWTEETEAKMEDRRNDTKLGNWTSQKIDHIDFTKKVVRNTETETETCVCWCAFMMQNPALY